MVSYTTGRATVVATTTMDQVQKTPCPVCGNTSSVLLRASDGTERRACNHCGESFTVTKPVQVMEVDQCQN